MLSSSIWEMPVEMTGWEAVRSKVLAAHRHAREWRMIIKGLLSTGHPILAHVIPIRRCNLSCGCCNEYDDCSKPVPLEVMLRRIDRLASLGTTIITVSGGEPLLHPELDEVIRRIRRHGIIAGLITNGYLLTADRIHRLNRAGLEHLQISVDNLVPDDVSKKSLKVLDRKLRLLAEHADFHVNINSVIGGIRDPENALVVARRAVALGFTSTVGIIHDGRGQMRPLTEAEQRIYGAINALGKRGYSRVNYFQENIAHGRPNNWRCRAGLRYLYICEKGLVHYCSQQRGYPGAPLEKYTLEDRQREHYTKKSCAPYCAVSCVQQVAAIDFWRHPQVIAGPSPEPLVQITPAVSEEG